MDSERKKKQKQKREPETVFSPLCNLRVGTYDATETFRSVNRHIAVCRPNGELIAVTGPDDDVTGESERIAQLFAAAPDLKAACEAISKADNYDEIEAAKELAKAALSKATGR